MSKKNVKLSKNELELKGYNEQNSIVSNDKISKEDLDKISKFTIKPVNKDQVRVYEALLIDDQVTRNSTHYPAEFQKMLLSLPHGEGNFIGSPFLLGDQDDHQEVASAQIGRIFDAHQVTDEKGHVGVMGKIYLLRDNNEETIKKIDTGILKEVSIATKVEMPICSICKQHIDTCEHSRGKEGCYVTMSGNGFCGEVSLVAIPGSPPAKILNEDALKGFARVESINGLMTENNILKKKLISVNERVDKLTKEFLIPALPALAVPFVIGAVKTVPVAISKTVPFLKKIMHSGLVKTIGKRLTGKIVNNIDAAVTGLVIAGVAAHRDEIKKVADKGISVLKRSLRKIKGASIFKKFFSKEALSKLPDNEKEIMENKFNELKNVMLDETNSQPLNDLERNLMCEADILPSGVESFPSGTESFETIIGSEKNIEELINGLESFNNSIGNIPGNPKIILDDNNNTSYFISDQKEAFGDGVFNVEEDPKPDVDKIKHNIKIASTLNSINKKITEANQKITMFGARYIISIDTLTTEPIPKMDEGLKGEDEKYITSVFYKNINTLYNNLKMIGTILNMPESDYSDYKGNLDETAKVVEYMYGKIENILTRVYQMQGRFNLEATQKEELIKETLRLGILANTVKIDKKENVKAMLDKMSYDQIKKLSDSFYTEGSKIYGPNIKIKEESKKDVNPVNVMDFKEIKKIN